MKTKAAKILASLMLLVFVNFMFSNTVFIHSHHLAGGRTVTHSHPFQPSSHHSHSQQSLDLISSLNCTAGSAEAVDCPPLSAAPQSYSLLECQCRTIAATVAPANASLRGPPYC
ncbi:MAG: hypothetical protein K2F74_04755 [Muribaculaceae bacterium]|nr:hypothetical protein [Muribaculaceae bacterium]MDE6130883.1 hypothetical protein [Muribaculaceae bacterium]